jgi:hypothetical protein
MATYIYAEALKIRIYSREQLSGLYRCRIACMRAAEDLEPVCTFPANKVIIGFRVNCMWKEVLTAIGCNGRRRRPAFRTVSWDILGRENNTIGKQADEYKETPIAKRTCTARSSAVHIPVSRG